MVYTKHFNIHTMKHLNQTESYIKNADKTLVDEIEAQHLENLFPYIANDDKTLSKQLVSGHHIVNVQNAIEEFYATKEMALRQNGTYLEFDFKTGKMIFNKAAIEKNRKGGAAIVGHHLIQSFSPEDNLTPEQIHEIGRKTMEEFSGGEYEFVIATHVDKDHIHNHIIMNSTNFMTGKEYPWKVIKLENGNFKNVSKENFEKISDKVASKYGAKIIQKEPKTTRTKYTKWQVENLYKNKIKSRIDFLVAHSKSIDDFIEKAAALNLHVDFNQKHSRFKLLDEPQIKMTRGRSLEKGQPDKYSKENIEEMIKGNDLDYSIEAIKMLYKEKVDIEIDNYDYQIKIEDWQISHKTEKGYYINLDFGVNNKGQVFVPAFKMDPGDNCYYLYLKTKDFFFYTSENKEQNNKYIPADILIKQMTTNNGSRPLYKEPVIDTLKELVTAVNFLARNGISDGNQLENLENKLQSSSEEAYNTLQELDIKIAELTNIAKSLLLAENDSSIVSDVQQQLIEHGIGKNISYDNLIEKIETYKDTRNLLNMEFERTLKEIEEYKKIKYVSHQYESEENKNRPSL